MNKEVDLNTLTRDSLCCDAIGGSETEIEVTPCQGARGVEQEGPCSFHSTKLLLLLQLSIYLQLI